MKRKDKTHSQSWPRLQEFLPGYLYRYPLASYPSFGTGDTNENAPSHLLLSDETCTCPIQLAKLNRQVQVSH
eukprot:1817278-Rhodomonas_salina.1